jgi:hypothetical protein
MSPRPRWCLTVSRVCVCMCGCNARVEFVCVCVMYEWISPPSGVYAANLHNRSYISLREQLTMYTGAWCALGVCVRARRRTSYTTCWIVICDSWQSTSTFVRLPPRSNRQPPNSCANTPSNDTKLHWTSLPERRRTQRALTEPRWFVPIW